eukprot:gene21646-28659_t
MRGSPDRARVTHPARSYDDLEKIEPDPRIGLARGPAKGVNFDEESWGQSLLEVKGCGYAIFASNCKAVKEEREDGDEWQNYSQSRPTHSKSGACSYQPQDAELPKEGYVRCLGYVGSYMMEFSSAARILSGLPALGSASRWLLEAVASPGSHATPLKVLTQYMDPQGQKGNKTLVTCTRNQAVNAVVEKVKDFGCVVFGNPKRLGLDSTRYTLNALVKRDPMVCWWKDKSDYLGRAIAQLSGPTDTLMYPGLQRLADIEADDLCYPSQAKRKACGRWFTVLKVGQGGRGARGPGLQRLADIEADEVRYPSQAKRRACGRWFTVLKVGQGGRGARGTGEGVRGP